MPRKSIISEEIIDAVVNSLRAGNYILTACEYAGISNDAYYDWIERAKDPDAPELFHKFAAEVKKARAGAEMRNVNNIQKAAQNGTWQASAWWLERSFPDRWGRRTTLTGPDNGPIQVEVSREDLTNRIMTLLEEDSDDGDDA